ncbi:hypothetical protein SAQ01S_16410 [Sphingomonas aquatilis NBRC 16722]|nr:hypothetical protein SAQ01S_16410 [Sphingomonas aquatilis NBRC 16722]
MTNADTGAAFTAAGVVCATAGIASASVAAPASAANFIVVMQSPRERPVMDVNGGEHSPAPTTGKRCRMKPSTTIVLHKGNTTFLPS